MSTFGGEQGDRGAVAVSQRAWALDNPVAQMRTPLPLEEYHRSPWIVEPLHLFDCCLVSNGGGAVVVTTQERASGLRQPPVRVLSWGQAHPGYVLGRGRHLRLVTGAAPAGAEAHQRAGPPPPGIHGREPFDCYTY